jgi:hypothetical protein
MLYYKKCYTRIEGLLHELECYFWSYNLSFNTFSSMTSPLTKDVYDQVQAYFDGLYPQYPELFKDKIVYPD